MGSKSLLAVLLRSWHFAMQRAPHTMQHKVPRHPTALMKWRQRVGAEKLVELLAEAMAAAQRDGHTTKQDLKQVNVDTTVMETSSRTRQIQSCTTKRSSSWVGRRSGVVRNCASRSFGCRSTRRSRWGANSPLKK